MGTLVVSVTVSARVIVYVVAALLGDWASEATLLALEIDMILCSLTKVHTFGTGLNETLLLVDLNEPTDSSSSTTIKLEPVVPREMLSQSISQSMSVSMIACVPTSTCFKGVLPT